VRLVEPLSRIRKKSAEPRLKKMPANAAMTTYFMNSSFKDGNTASARTWRLWVAVLAGVVVTGVALWAAHWQHGRAQEKREMQALVDVATAAPPIDLNLVVPPFTDVFRRAFVSGRFVPEKAVYLDNRPLDGRVGRVVMMPLQLENGSVILVVRGWIAQDAARRGVLPTIQTPSSAVRIEGVLADHVPQFAKFADVYPPELPAVWPNFDMAAYRQASGYKNLQWVLMQTNDVDDRLTRSYTPPSLGVEKHLGYRLQWIAIALLSAGLTVFFGMRALLRKPIVSADS
jgi:cytochrome oxidase assembly protein ShyY1